MLEKIFEGIRKLATRPDYERDEFANYENPDWDYIAPKLVVDKSIVNYLHQRCSLALSHCGRYKNVSTDLGGKIPWQFIAALHERESSQDFSRILHNGEQIIGTDKKTSWVPKNRGPFASWEEAACDALKLKGYHEHVNWSFADCLRKAEIFNGLGYRRKIGNTGKIELSPYVVAYTNFHDENSKYVSDGKYDPNAREGQLSVAVMLIGLGLNA